MKSYTCVRWGSLLLFSWIISAAEIDYARNGFPEGCVVNGQFYAVGDTFIPDPANYPCAEHICVKGDDGPLEIMTMHLQKPVFEILAVCQKSRNIRWSKKILYVKLKMRISWILWHFFTIQFQSNHVI
uniref:Secreted protein n=1 Tax=Magallana gigas TaxID=29159 RepID=A0A8W8NCK3_MAGGI